MLGKRDIDDEQVEIGEHDADADDRQNLGRRGAGRTNYAAAINRMRDSHGSHYLARRSGRRVQLQRINSVNGSKNWRDTCPSPAA